MALGHLSKPINGFLLNLTSSINETYDVMTSQRHFHTSMNAQPILCPKEMSVCDTIYCKKNSFRYTLFYEERVIKGDILDGLDGLCILLQIFWSAAARAAGSST